MGENYEKKEMKSKQEAVEKIIESIFDELDTLVNRAKELDSKVKRHVNEKIIKKMEDVEMEAVFIEIDNFFDRAKKLSAKIKKNADGLISKLTGYFQGSVDS